MGIAKFRRFAGKLGECGHIIIDPMHPEMRSMTWNCYRSRAQGRSYVLGEGWSCTPNKASKEPFTQASLRCNKWLNPASLQRIPTPLNRCWMSHLHALSTIPLPRGKPKALYAS